MSINHNYLVCKRRLDRSSPMGYGSDASLTRPSRATAAAHSGSPPALYRLLRLASAPRESAPVPVRTGHRSARSSMAIRGRTDPRRRADVGLCSYEHNSREGVNPTSLLNQRICALARIVRVRCRSRTVRSRIYQLADRHRYACTHIKFIKIRSFERACGPAEVGYSEQVARMTFFRCDRP